MRWTCLVSVQKYWLSMWIRLWSWFVLSHFAERVHWWLILPNSCSKLRLTRLLHRVSWHSSLPPHTAEEKYALKFKDGIGEGFAKTSSSFRVGEGVRAWLDLLAMAEMFESQRFTAAALTRTEWVFLWLNDNWWVSTVSGYSESCCIIVNLLIQHFIMRHWLLLLPDITWSSLHYQRWSLPALQYDQLIIITSYSSPGSLLYHRHHFHPFSCLSQHLCYATHKQSSSVYCRWLIASCTYINWQWCCTSTMCVAVHSLLPVQTNWDNTDSKNRWYY